MLITIQKQVEETLEVKTPCYYKTLTGYAHLNDKGQFITVYTRMISMWEPSEGKHYINDIQNMLKHGMECSKDEFEKVYGEAKAGFDIAVGAVLF